MMFVRDASNLLRAVTRSTGTSVNLNKDKLSPAAK